MAGLTPKQEKFAQLYVELGDASEAYRRSYDTSKMKPASVNRTAKAQVDNVKIAARIATLKESHAKRHAVTVDTLVAELEEARQIALGVPAPSAAVAATMGKAKLLGLDQQRDTGSAEDAVTALCKLIDKLPS